MMFRFLTSGESHGKCLVGILEGLPRGIEIDAGYVNLQLRRRQLGYGRGSRMEIEEDRIEILSGVRQGKTLGSPLSFSIQNRDHEQWKIPMSVERTAEGTDLRPVSHPRPGHSDLAGALKYQTHDVRDILERASARETAARVAGGAFCRLFLARFGIRIGSHVVAVGKERVSAEFETMESGKILTLSDSPLRCADPESEKRMMALIDATAAAGDTVGGTVEVAAGPVPPGLGSHIQWDRRLDGRIAQAMMSIPSAKAVEIGAGIQGARTAGSAFHDAILYDPHVKRFRRETNRAGGIEGGMSNGADIRVRIYLKPIPTLRRALKSVDVRSKEPFEAAVERGDTCVVPAAGVVAEAMLGLILAEAFMEKFGGDSVEETNANYSNFLKLLDEY
jgi:chorismate synthase